MSVGKLSRYGLPFSNVVASGVATANVTPGRTIENITLSLGGTSFTKAMISLYRLKANGKTILEGSGSQIDALNAYRGIASNAAFLDIAFADLAGLTELDRMLGALDTSVGITNITQEVTIAGATAPTLKQILTEAAAQRDTKGQPAPFAGLMAKVLRYPFNVSTGGTLPVTVPFGPQNGSIIKRLHVFHGGNMTGATVKQDGMVIHESVKAENEFEQGRHGRVPQNNVYTIDFVVDGNMRKALDTRTSRSLEWLFDFSAADTGFVVVEYLDALQNL